MKVLKHLTAVVFVCLVAAEASGQHTRGSSLFSKENLVAWCIVPYDNMNRTPVERARMLRDLGITQLAYDWREKHLPRFAEEIHALKENNIKLKSVWFWINGTDGRILDEANHHILKTLEENRVKTELWLSFNDRFFDGLSDEEKFTKAVDAIAEINRRVKAIGCTLHLYNHGNWFGEPVNQVKIIEAIGTGDIGIVYNFHHARHQVQAFPELLKVMLPYLSTVNINGMKEGGPMIVTVGQGDHELEMLKALKGSGFSGSIGILSHVEDEDAKVVLQRNITGLTVLLQKMGDKKSLKTY